MVCAKAYIAILSMVGCALARRDDDPSRLTKDEQEETKEMLGIMIGVIFFILVSMAILMLLILWCCKRRSKEKIKKFQNNATNEPPVPSVGANWTLKEENDKSDLESQRFETPQIDVEEGRAPITPQ